MLWIIMQRTVASQCSVHEGIELVPGGFTFPLRALHEAKEPKPDHLEDNVIEEPRPIPYVSEMQQIADVQPEHESADEEQPDKSPVEEIFPEIKYTPSGQIIPGGFHWDGTRLVKAYEGSKRPENIPSDFWRMLSPKEREMLVAEEAAKFAGSSGSGAPSSSSAKASKRKKKPEPATVAKQLRVNPSPSGDPTTAAVCWEVIPEGRPKFCVPAMPKAVPAKAELHRPELRELIKNKIRELEFKVALELFGAVAWLVPNPKAKAALARISGSLSHLKSPSSNALAALSGNLPPCQPACPSHIGSEQQECLTRTCSWWWQGQSSRRNIWFLLVGKLAPGSPTTLRVWPLL